MSTETQLRELNKQLYPTGRAWGFVHGSEQSETIITSFVDGIGQPFVDGDGNQFIQIFGSETSISKRLINADLKSFERLYDSILSILNIIIPDNDEFSETDASNWERVLALFNSDLTLVERKDAINRKLAYPNGVPERAHYLFIQDQLRANGFDVYVTENRFPDGSGGWEVEDPDTLSTELYQFGTSEFGVAEFEGEFQGIDYSIVANYIDEDLDATYFDEVFSPAEFGNIEFGVTEFQTPDSLPRQQQLRYTFFIGGQSFPSKVTVPLTRKTEFRQLILSLKQVHTIALLYIDYI